MRFTQHVTNFFDDNVVAEVQRRNQAAHVKLALTDQSISFKNASCQACSARPKSLLFSMVLVALATLQTVFSRVLVVATSSRRRLNTRLYQDLHAAQQAVAIVFVKARSTCEDCICILKRGQLVIKIVCIAHAHAHAHKYFELLCSAHSKITTCFVCTKPTKSHCICFNFLVGLLTNIQHMFTFNAAQRSSL